MKICKKKLESLSEMFYSEKSYIADLKMWQITFRNKFKNIIEAYEKTKNELITAVFSNVSDIYILHRIIFRDLRRKNLEIIRKHNESLYKYNIKEYKKLKSKHAKEKNTESMRFMTTEDDYSEELDEYSHESDYEFELNMIEGINIDELEYASVYLKRLDHFKKYEIYIKSLTKSIYLFDKMCFKNAQIRTKIENFMIKHNIDNLGPTHYFYRPSGKIVRYPVLVEAMLKRENIEKNKCLYKEFLNKMEKITHDIDVLLKGSVSLCDLYLLNRRLIYERKLEWYPFLELDLLSIRLLKSGKLLSKVHTDKPSKMHQVMIFNKFILFSNSLDNKFDDIQLIQTPVFLYHLILLYEDTDLVEIEPMYRDKPRIYLIDKPRMIYMILYFEDTHMKDIYYNLLKEAIENMWNECDSSAKIDKMKHVFSSEVKSVSFVMNRKEYDKKIDTMNPNNETTELSLNGISSDYENEFSENESLNSLNIIWGDDKKKFKENKNRNGLNLISSMYESNLINSITEVSLNSISSSEKKNLNNGKSKIKLNKINSENETIDTEENNNDEIYILENNYKEEMSSDSTRETKKFKKIFKTWKNNSIIKSHYLDLEINSITDYTENNIENRLTSSINESIRPNSCSGSYYQNRNKNQISRTNETKTLSSSSGNISNGVFLKYCENSEYTRKLKVERWCLGDIYKNEKIDIGIGIERRFVSDFLYNASNKEPPLYNENKNNTLWKSWKKFFTDTFRESKLSGGVIKVIKVEEKEYKEYKERQKNMVIYSTCDGIYKMIDGISYKVSDISADKIIYNSDYKILMFSINRNIYITAFDCDSECLNENLVYDDAYDFYISSIRENKMFLGLLITDKFGFYMINIFTISETDDDVKLSHYCRFHVGSLVQRIEFVDKYVIVASTDFLMIDLNSLATIKMLNSYDTLTNMLLANLKNMYAVKIFPLSKKRFFICYNSVGFFVNNSGSVYSTKTIFNWESEINDVRIFGNIVLCLSKEYVKAFNLCTGKKTLDIVMPNCKFVEGTIDFIFFQDKQVYYYKDGNIMKFRSAKPSENASISEKSKEISVNLEPTVNNSQRNLKENSENTYSLEIEDILNEYCDDIQSILQDINNLSIRKDENLCVTGEIKSCDENVKKALDVNLSDSKSSIKSGSKNNLEDGIIKEIVNLPKEHKKKYELNKAITGLLKKHNVERKYRNSIGVYQIINDRSKERDLQINKVNKIKIDLVIPNSLQFFSYFNPVKNIITKIKDTQKINHSSNKIGNFNDDDSLSISEIIENYIEEN